MDRVSQAIDEVLNDPRRFMASFWKAEREKRIEALGLDEERAKRGWYGYELPGCQWTEHHRPTEAEANWRSWPRIAPKYIIKTQRSDGTYTCLLLRRAIEQMPEKEWEEVVDEIQKVKDDYPLVSEDEWSNVQMEHQDVAWEETYRAEFREALKASFEGVFLDLQMGDRIQEKFNELVETNEFVDDIFYDYLRNGRGGEWNEHSDGSMSIDVDKIVNELKTQDMVDGLWPEDPRQLHLKLESLAKSLVSRLLDEDDGPHSYSCIMINLPEELADKIRAWGREQIPDKDIYVDEDGGMGREEEIHVTVKYGLTASEPDDRLKAVFNKTQPFEITLGPCSIFENGEFDVVKMDVHSPYLLALNRNVHAVADAPGDKHPTYIPHVTIAYVKPGTGTRFVGSSPFDSAMKFGVTSIGEEGHFTAKSVIFSSLDGSKKEYPLGHSDLTAEPVKEAEEPSEDEMSRFISASIPLRFKDPKKFMEVMSRSKVSKLDIIPFDKSERSWGKSALLRVTYDKGDGVPRLAEWEWGHLNSLKGWLQGNKPPVSFRMVPIFFDGRPVGKLDQHNTWLLRIKEAMGDSPDEMDAFIKKTIPTERVVGTRTARRLFGRAVVDRVEISSAEIGGKEGFHTIPKGWMGALLEIYFFVGSELQVWRDYWMSRQVLAEALRRWTNLQGAKLVVDGQDAGTVDYNNPVLAKGGYLSA